MCVADGADRNQHHCDEPGDPELFGFCGYCFAKFISPAEAKQLLMAKGLWQPETVTQVVTRHEPGLGPWAVTALCCLSALAGAAAVGVWWCCCLLRAAR